MADFVGSEERGSGTGKFLAVVGAYVGGGAKRGEKVVLEGGGYRGGGAVRDEAEQAKFAVAAYCCEKVFLGGVRGAEVGDEVKAPRDARPRWEGQQ